MSGMTDERRKELESLAGEFESRPPSYDSLAQWFTELLARHYREFIKEIDRLKARVEFQGNGISSLTEKCEVAESKLHKARELLEKCRVVLRASGRRGLEHEIRAFLEDKP